MKTSNRLKDRLSGNYLNIFVGVLLTVYTALFIWLLVWAFASTFKNYQSDILLGKNYSGFPSKWVTENYKTVWEAFREIVTIDNRRFEVNAFGMIQNTLIYTVGCALAGTLIPCITAYVVARYAKKFRWLNIYTAVVLTCMIIPIVGSTPSEIQITKALGLYDSLWGMIILKANFLGMYYLVFHELYRGMPAGYEEAARIDGASNLKIFTKIYFPLSIKTFGTIMLILGITFWNDYQTPLLYLDSHPTLALWFFRFKDSTINALSYLPVRVTGAMFLIVPIFIIFVALNKRLMGSLSLGGLKE